MILKSLIFGIAVAISNANDKVDGYKGNKSCLALALSGGGSKGSYQAGVLYGLVMNDADKSKYSYDIISGVSAGSINAFALSIFPKGEEVSMVKYISDTWANLKESNVFKRWSPFGIITGFTEKQGIFDNSPLTQTLTNILNQFPKKVQRNITASCVDVNTGNYYLMNETSDDIVKVVVSSGSMPAAFPPQIWPDGTVCMDGGTVWDVNLVSAIERCRKVVDDDSQITLDVVITDMRLVPEWKDQKNAFSNFLRFKDIKDYYEGASNVYNFIKAFPNINYRHYIQPTQPVAGSLGILDFNNATNTWPMQLIGRLDGQNAIKQEEGYVFKKLNDWESNRELQSQFPSIGDYIQHVIDSNYDEQLALQKDQQIFNSSFKQNEINMNDLLMQ